MTATKLHAPYSRTPEFSKRKLLQRAVASAIAAGALVAASAVDARIVSVQMSAPTVAFGGFSWPGVGQYVRITGVAYAEVDPGDPRNAVITDIALAQAQPAGLVNDLPQPGKTAAGKVGYLLNFYILKPENLAAVSPTLVGYGKVMYEPPNRGGKTWTALGRVSGGGNDPATITDPTVLANSFLMPTGFTLGLERMGALDDARHPRHQPDPGGGVAHRRQPERLHDHGSGLRIQRGLDISLSYTPATLGQDPWPS